MSQSVLLCILEPKALCIGTYQALLETTGLLAGFCPKCALLVRANQALCVRLNHALLETRRLLAGYCPHGVKCQHAHSAEELRVSVLIQSDVLDEEYHIEFCQSLVRGGTCAIGAAPSSCLFYSSVHMTRATQPCQSEPQKLIDRHAKSFDAAVVHIQWQRVVSQAWTLKPYDHVHGRH